MPDDLTTAAGIAALAAGGVALLALLLVLVLWIKLRRVRSAQTTVLGTSGERDLVTHAENLEIGFAQLQGLVEETFRARRGAPREGRGDASSAASARPRSSATTPTAR